MKSVLALDVSVTATGWGFGRPDERPVSGVVRFAPKDATDDELWVAAMKWMTQQMNILKPDVIAIEAPFIRMTGGEDGSGSNATTILKLWSLQAIIRMVVKAKRPGAAMLIHASSARKILTGKGNYSKGEAKPAVMARCKQLGWVDADERSHDRCDALAVWAAGCAAIDPDFTRRLNAADLSLRERAA